jgi:hypothetical protein
MRQGGRGEGGTVPGELSQRLDRLAAAVSEDASCVGQWHVDLLQAQLGSQVTAAEVREALERRGVRVAELPRLPAEPPAQMALHPDFVDSVLRLGQKLSIELVFGRAQFSFRLLGGLRFDDGYYLDAEAIADARRRLPESVNHDERERILSILADAASRPEALDEIVFWEVVQVLRPLAPLGLSQRAITEQAVRLSLERREAELLAAAIAEEKEILKSPRRSPDGSALPAVRPLTPGLDSTAAVKPVEMPEPPAPSPSMPLQAVMDLRSRALPGRNDIVQLSWTPPPTGVLSLRMAAEPPSWSEGSVIAAREVDSYGQPLSASGMLGPDQRMSHELTLPTTRTFVTAFTVRAADAVRGRSVEITRGAPVRGLSAQRFGEAEVRLTWEWPDEAIAAYVAWQPLTVADQRGQVVNRPQRCSRREFEDNGGFAALMGYAAQRIEVWAVFKGHGREDRTAPAETEVPAIGVPVRYSFRRVPGPLGAIRRQRELVLTSEQPCILPDLVVIECKRPGLPLTPHDDDDIVAKIPGRPIDPGEVLREVIRLSPRGPSWIGCFIDPAEPAVRRGLVTLVVPPERQLRVR